MNSFKEDIELSIEEPKEILAMNAQKFALWLFIVTIIMLFAALTSAYIVRKAEGNWILIDLPFLFWINSAVLLASSITMHGALLAAKKDQVRKLKTAITITAILGFGFLIGQYIAWNDLMANGIFFNGDNSNVAFSFLYVLTGAHAIHLVSGVVFLVIALVSAFRLKIHSKRMVRIEMCATYWHFLDILWLYLFGFLLFNN